MGFLKWGVAVLAVAFSVAAAAQSYPTKPVRLVIAFTPGSSTDIIGRVVAAKLQELWGQPVVPENRVGAGGSVGSAVVVKADPDGYTLLANSSAHAANPGIYASLPYDTLKDFVNLALLGGGPNVLMVGNGVGWKTVKEFVDAAKAKYWATEMQGKVIDAGVQMHGGYGYMIEYPVARAYIDARAQRIYGGTNEIMKEIIHRDLLRS